MFFSYLTVQLRCPRYLQVVLVRLPFSRN
uniref:Uncharacterized protein n=1 Tax=Arundo donax TaxID=35708 RepID=A0A0A9A5X0_ARUDO